MKLFHTKTTLYQIKATQTKKRLIGRTKLVLRWSSFALSYGATWCATWGRGATFLILITWASRAFNSILCGVVNAVEKTKTEEELRAGQGFTKEVSFLLLTMFINILHLTTPKLRDGFRKKSSCSFGFCPNYLEQLLFFGKPSLRPSWWRPSPWWVLFCVQTFQLKSGQVWAIHRMAEMLLNKDLRSLNLATVPMMFRSSVLSNTGHFCEAGLRKCLLQTLPDHLWWGIWAVYHTWPIFILVPALVTSLCRYLTWAEHYRWVKVDRITAEWITSKILKISLFFLAPQVLLWSYQSALSTLLHPSIPPT